jgi:hypothetical protein
MMCTPPAPKVSTFGPVAWEVTIVETRDPNEFAKTLASVFAANKDKLKTELTNQLPSKRQETEGQAEAASATALLTYRLAVLQVETAEAKLQEAATDSRSAQLVLQADVIRAKSAANAAAKAAGQQPPYAL